MLSAAFFSLSCRSCSCAKRFSFRAPDSRTKVFLSVLVIGTTGALVEVGGAALTGAALGAGAGFGVDAVVDAGDFSFFTLFCAGGFEVGVTA